MSQLPTQDRKGGLSRRQKCPHSCTGEILQKSAPFFFFQSTFCPGDAISVLLLILHTAIVVYFGSQRERRRRLRARPLLSLAAPFLQPFPSHLPLSLPLSAKATFFPSWILIHGLASPSSLLLWMGALLRRRGPSLIQFLPCGKKICTQSLRSSVLLLLLLLCSPPLFTPFRENLACAPRQCPSEHLSCFLQKGRERELPKGRRRKKGGEELGEDFFASSSSPTPPPRPRKRERKKKPRGIHRSILRKGEKRERGKAKDSRRE